MPRGRSSVGSSDAARNGQKSTLRAQSRPRTPKRGRSPSRSRSRSRSRSNANPPRVNSSETESSKYKGQPSSPSITSRNGRSPSPTHVVSNGRVSAAALRKKALSGSGVKVRYNSNPEKSKHDDDEDSEAQDESEGVRAISPVSIRQRSMTKGSPATNNGELTTDDFIAMADAQMSPSGLSSNTKIPYSTKDVSGSSGTEGLVSLPSAVKGSLSHATITKMPEVEELADLYIHRPIAGLIVYVLIAISSRLPQPLKVTPSGITFFCLLTGIVASYFLLCAAFNGTTLYFPSIILSYLQAIYINFITSQFAITYFTPNLAWIISTTSSIFYSTVNLLPSAISSSILYFTQQLFTSLSSTLSQCFAVLSHPVVLSSSSCYTVTALLMFLTSVIDCADGQYARATGMGSFLGRMTDGIVDMCVITCNSLAFSTCMCMKYGLAGYILSVTSCICLQQHCLVYDKVKNAYVLHLKRDPELTVTANEVWDMMLVAIKELRPIDSILLWVSYFYVSASQIHVTTPEDPREREAYRQANIESMRMAAFLGTGTHGVIMYLCVGLIPWYPHAGLFFVFTEGVIMVALNYIIRQRVAKTMPSSCQLRFWDQEAKPIKVWITIGLLGMFALIYTKSIDLPQF